MINDSILFKAARIFQFLIGIYCFLLIVGSLIENISRGAALSEYISLDFILRAFYGVLFVFPYMKFKNKNYILVYGMLLLLCALIGVAPMIFTSGNPQLAYTSLIFTVSMLFNVFFILNMFRSKKDTNQTTR